MNTRFRSILVVACALVTGACGSSGPDSANAASRTSPDDPRAVLSVAGWRAQIDTLALQVAELDAAARALRTVTDASRVKQAFVKARHAFKRAEVALEYYAPTTAKEINGPPLPEVHDEDGPENVFPPTGFQVIEEALYGSDPIGEREAIVRETSTLLPLVKRAQTMMGAQQSSDAHVWDAIKLELARIATLGVTGFDSPVAGHSLAEADAALEGVVRTLAPYHGTDSVWRRVDSLIAVTRATLTATSDRDTFDHFTFLSQRLIPLGHAIRAARLVMAIGLPADARAFRMDAATVFDSAAFDVMGFAPLDAKPGTPAQVALGAQLFHDAQLSGDRKRACSSCHLPEQAFTDGLTANTARGGAPLARNTPTVINSGLQMGSFADLRTTYLEDQVTDVVQNVDEMHGNLASVAARLAEDSLLVTQFRRAFANTPARTDSAITAAQIRTALAAYQRSLSRLNAPVDRALRGETGALTDEERRGFNVFVGKGKCATCHFVPLTNGTVPPMYREAEVEVLGTPSRALTVNATIDPDEGRFRLTRAAPHRYAFKTPSLRNVALTSPYMHNGVYRTLEAVVDFYNRGGGAGIGIQLDNQTLPPAPLRLSASEQRALVSFMKALTDTAGTKRPEPRP